MSPLGQPEIERILPHRDPFLFVREVLEIVPGKRILGVVRFADPASFLERAAGGEPCLPATLLAEAMAQVGAVLVLHPPEHRGRTIYFRAIERARFRKRVPADAAVRVEAVVRRMRSRLGTLRVRAFLEDQLAAEGVMTFALSD